jgi:hypothetical protein
MKWFILFHFFISFSLFPEEIWKGEGIIQFQYEKWIYPPYFGKIIKLYIKKGEKIQKNQKLALIRNINNEKEKIHWNQSSENFQETLFKDKMVKEKEIRSKRIEMDKLNQMLEKKKQEKIELSSNKKMKKELFNENLISKSEWDHLEFEEAMLDRSILSLQNEFNSLENSLLNKEIEKKNWYHESLKLLEESKKDLLIRSPISGFIIESKKLEGEFVPPSGSSNDSICYIVSSAKILQFALPESIHHSFGKKKLQYEINNKWNDCYNISNDQKIDPKTSKINYTCSMSFEDYHLPQGKNLKIRLVDL